MNLLRDFFKNRSGATAVEYGLITALIAVALISGLGAVGTGIQNVFGVVSTDVSTPAP